MKSLLCPVIRFCSLSVWTCVILAGALFAPPASAQVDTGTVQGTVRDATGGVVPGARVTLINVDMGVSFQTKTNDVGSYQFPSVRIGNYTLVAEAPGFAPATREGITAQHSAALCRRLLAEAE